MANLHYYRKKREEKGANSKERKRHRKKGGERKGAEARQPGTACLRLSLRSSFLPLSVTTLILCATAWNLD